MFFYFYDAFVTDKGHSAILNAIEGRIVELGINGRVEKLTPLRNMKELLEDGIKHEAHTIVVVGNDSTFIRVLNIVAPHNVVLGYIPFPRTSVLGTIFGLGDSLSACDVLSRRIVTSLNLAKASQSYFLGSLIIEHANTVVVNCDDQYTVTNQVDDLHLTIENFGSIIAPPNSAEHYNQHTKLQLQLKPYKTKTALFSHGFRALLSTTLPASKISLTHTDQPVTAIIDNEIKLKTPFIVTLKVGQLKIIVGKNRLIR